LHEEFRYRNFIIGEDTLKIICVVSQLKNLSFATTVTFLLFYVGFLRFCCQTR